MVTWKLKPMKLLCLHQNPVTGINGQKASPEAFARAYQTYFHRILAVMRSQH